MRAGAARGPGDAASRRFTILTHGVCSQGPHLPPPAGTHRHRLLFCSLRAGPRLFVGNLDTPDRNAAGSCVLSRDFCLALLPGVALQRPPDPPASARACLSWLLPWTTPPSPPGSTSARACVCLYCPTSDCVRVCAAICGSSSAGPGYRLAGVPRRDLPPPPCSIDNRRMNEGGFCGLGCCLSARRRDLGERPLCDSAGHGAVQLGPVLMPPAVKLWPSTLYSPSLHRYGVPTSRYTPLRLPRVWSVSVGLMIRCPPVGPEPRPGVGDAPRSRECACPYGRRRVRSAAPPSPLRRGWGVRGRLAHVRAATEHGLHPTQSAAFRPPTPPHSAPSARRWLQRNPASVRCAA